MEIDRPFRIKLPSHKAPEKVKENLSSKEAKPLDQQLKQGLEDVFRRAMAERSANINPNRTEKSLQEFEAQWTEKLETAGAKNLAPDLHRAIDSIRSGEEPNTEFTIGLRPQFKMTPESVRRVAKDRTSEREI